MRNSNFLRTPIRFEHQGRIQNLQVSEQPLVGDPDPNDPYPQALRITFSTSEQEVQIAALWEGRVRFIADSTAGYPQNLEEVTEANFSAWPVVGDLVLHTEDFSLHRPFATHIPLIATPPSLVRYSKVRLTREFIFSALQQIRLPTKWREGDQVVTVTDADPSWHQKLVIAFLHGHASIGCFIDPSDPAKDFTNNPMPSVALVSAGQSTLTITASSRAMETMSPTWFNHQPEYDDIPGVGSLVNPAIADSQHRHYNPAHPGHSVIPLGAVFATASEQAFEDQHRGSTLRTTISGIQGSETTYRRIDVVRPPRPGEPVSSEPQRPFPQYQVNWKKTDDALIHSLRLPLSGHVYLPLVDGRYKFWAIGRGQNPNAVSEGDQLKVGLKADDRHYVDMPAGSVVVDILQGDSTKKIFAHLFDYDSSQAWHAFATASLAEDITPLQRKYAKRWGLFKLRDDGSTYRDYITTDWFLFPRDSATMKTYKPLYGHIAAAAGRHEIAPELLQAVFMGEGANERINPARAFVSDELLEAFDFLGLDLILYRTGRLPSGFPAYPPQIPAANADEIDEYSFNLVTSGYLDPVTAAAVTRSREVTRAEAGPARTFQIANVVGWGAAVELVAAELHARLDEMSAYCAAHDPPISINEEARKRYLAYVRFNASVRTARDHADDLIDGLKAWKGDEPYPLRLDHPDLARVNALLVLAVSQYIEQLGVYR